MSDTQTIVSRATSEGTRMTDDTLSALRSVPILDLVEGCQEALTSGDDRSASIAIYILGRASQARSTADPINKAALITLIQFFGLKTRKYGTCDAAVEATSNLLQAAASPSTAPYLLDDIEAMSALVEHFLPHVHAQSLLLNTRRHFLSIFKLIVLGDAQQRALRTISASPLAPRFLKSFLTSVDGERDPTMLLEVFQMHRVLLDEFPAESVSFLLEDMFESMSCYFPVLFTPPAGCQVTRQQLKSALGAALQSASFHELCLPFLCGKLSSPSANSKHDSLDLLNGIFGPTSQYTQEMQLPHVPEVLTTLRAEALKLSAYQDRSPEAVDTLRNSLRTVTLVARTVAQGVQDRSVVLSLLEPIVGGAVSTIETDAASGRTYATLLHAAGRADVRVAATMSSYLFPFISSLIDEAPSNASLAIRRAENCLSCLGGLLSAMEELCATSPDKTAVLTTLTSETSFAKAVVVHKLYESLSLTATTHHSPYVLRVACESVATWIAMAKHSSSLGGASTTSSAWSTAITATTTSPWKILVDRSFAADIDAEIGGQIASSIGNATRVDAAGFVELCRELLLPWGTHPRFLDIVKSIAEASRRNDVVVALIQCLFSDHAAAILSNADEAWGDRHEVDKQLFGLAAWLMTLCNEEAIVQHCESWIEQTLSLSGGVPSFEFAALLFAGASHEVQVAALQKTLHTSSSGAIDPSVHTATTTSRRYSMMVLCGSSPKAVTEAVPSQVGATYAVALIRSVLAGDNADVPQSISLRCLEALLNKVKLLPEQYAELWAARGDCALTSSQGSLMMTASIAKGLLSRGATKEGNQWVDELLKAITVAAHTTSTTTGSTEEGCFSATDAAVAAGQALGSVLAPPLPIVSSALWDQRFFQKSVQSLVSSSTAAAMNSCEEHRLAALCALVVHGKSGHVKVAMPAILTYVKSCVESSPEPRLWRHIAELLRSLYESDKHSEDEAECTPTSVHPCLELILLRREVFDGIALVLTAAFECPMSGKRAALFLLKAIALEVERVREHAASDETDDTSRIAQPGAVRRDAGPTYAVATEVVLGAARHCEKLVSKITQPSLSHSKRLVRTDAAECRRVWDRIRK